MFLASVRDKLANREGLRGRWTATLVGEREFTRGGYPVTRLLFREVCDETGEEVTDHIHFEVAKCWEGIAPGQRVEFYATVRTYWKGYAGERHMDFRLSHPTKVRILEARKPRGPAKTPATNGMDVLRKCLTGNPDQYLFPGLFSA